MILVDTSVWGRLADKADPLYGAARAGVQKVIRDSMDPAVAAQTLYEFWVVATRPVGGNGLGWTPDRTGLWITTLKRACRFLPEDARTFEVWEKLVRAHGTSGKPAHDARLAAVMALHGISTILTFNGKDFVRYGITVLDPRTI